jgi:hypothetical protein
MLVIIRVISAVWEAEIERISVQAQLRGKISETACDKQARWGRHSYARGIGIGRMIAA